MARKLQTQSFEIGAADENDRLANELRETWSAFQSLIGQARLAHAKADALGQSIEANNSRLRSLDETKRMLAPSAIRRAVIGDGMRFSDGTVDHAKLTQNGKAVDKVLAGLGAMRALGRTHRRTGRAMTRVGA